MAAIVEEIMNRELFSLSTSELARDALTYIVALGISGAPVVDADGVLVGVVSMRDLVTKDTELVSILMTAPPLTIGPKATIEQAGRIMGESGYHRLVVVDDGNKPIGVVSSLDIVRGLVGLPTGHPSTFPHYDQDTGAMWSDDRILELDRIEAAPEEAGVFVIIRGGAGSEERPVWVEESKNIRARLIDILTAQANQPTELRRILALRELRFRTARIQSSAARSRTAERLMAKIYNGRSN
jgi:hypothetical protein